MQWLAVGRDGEAFRQQIEENPGWYWIYRPACTGPGAFDPDRGVLLPVLVHADGRLGSPLTDLQSTRTSDLVPRDENRGLAWQCFFAGPVHPADRPTRHLEKLPGAALVGDADLADGWYWCATQAPLNHVDARGIGPIFVTSQDGTARVYPAAHADGTPADVFELGFAEPLVSDGGLIDESGEIGRHSADIFGTITAPPALPPSFPTVGGA